jgi:hypothetical protein
MTADNSPRVVHHVNLNPATTEKVQRDWQTWRRGVPLVTLDSPFRSLREPLLGYITGVGAEPDTSVTVVLPECVPAKWWHHLFHNQSALLIKGSLLFSAAAQRQGPGLCPRGHRLSSR